ncbi:CAAD domain-containing protein [Geitlerinema sp. PCC 7407]|uniref:CAAD domain-containing protein n=1 Tax=Geitlerinema sp. PCC 7407 TaxID=1173025 RepID=UPI00029FC156|nr:CAAD domain-containing protein [Geitlerinema sp. PCC 7407]AFY65879.1 hypothetical protein GEI7407_1385 [Geitlerinema sp. PCC 7407]
MDPETNKTEFQTAEVATPTEFATMDVNADRPGAIAPISRTKNKEQWEEIRDQVYEVLAQLPEYISSFFADNRRPLITVGLILTAFVTAKVTLAVLSAINEVPLLSPFFEVVGIAYSGWFTYRYLLRASSRKELADEVSSLKDQVIGGSQR